MVAVTDSAIRGDLLIIYFAPKLGFFPRSGEKSKVYKIFLEIWGISPDLGKIVQQNIGFFSNNFFSIPLSGLKNELFHSLIDYACP